MTEHERPNPDALLAAIQSADARAQRRRLKVFLGMCAGVGKTFAMLEAARRERDAGRDVVIGYLETHGRKDTDALAEGLPVLPRRQGEYRGLNFSEFDLDAALARRPQLILVDEFAHTNAPDSRHPKRWQDVMELLDAGLDVFTTLNIQHMESRAEAVRQITGVTIHETVPDTALAGAEFELVDLPPDDLRARLAAGKVYLPERAATAQDSFFRAGNLAALRELALRFAADRVGQDVLTYRHAHGIAVPWKSGQRLLVAVSPSPSSASLVRWTRRLAGELHAAWVAAYVERPGTLSPEDQTRLEKNLALARELGAEIVTTTDDEVVRGLLRTAREQNVSQIVVGKPAGWRMLDIFRGGSMLNRLIRDSGAVDVHIVRAEAENVPARPPRPLGGEGFSARSYGAAFGVVAVVTALNLLLDHWFGGKLLGNQALALIYLLSVVVLAVFVGRGATLAAATVTALLWDFFFAEPRGSFRITNAGDVIMFFTYFVVAVAMGQLTARIRSQQQAERQREQRATALYLLTRELAESADLAQLLAVVIRQVGESFRAKVALSLPASAEENVPSPYFASTWLLPEKEQSVAAWAFLHRQPAGRGTDTLSSSEGLHLPLVAGERATGVLSLKFADEVPLTPAQRDLLDAFVRQVGLVLDRQRLRDAELEAQLVAESERLGKTLLNSVSHELRTPLAAINTAASGLHSAGPLTPAQMALTEELDEATTRLNRLVQNLLDLSRLEAGHLKPNPDWHDLRDVIAGARQNLGRSLAGHPVTVSIPADFPPVRLDAVLTEQILVNLLGNVNMHTPAGTPVEIRARFEGGKLVLEVSDRGPGLPPGDADRWFEKFQRGPDAVAGGTGLGLSLVKGFAEAQGGTVAAANQPGGGALFTVRLPAAPMPPLPEDKE